MALNLSPGTSGRGGSRPGADRKPLPIGGPRDDKVLAAAIKLASAETIAELFSFAQQGNLGALLKLSALFERARLCAAAAEGRQSRSRKSRDDRQAALFE